MNKIYLVTYTTGSYEDYSVIPIFATTKKSTATRYVTKFNKMLKKWQNHYKQFEEEMAGIRWIKEEYVEQHYHRWHQLRNTNKSEWQEISLR